MEKSADSRADALASSHLARRQPAAGVVGSLVASVGALSLHEAATPPCTTLLSLPSGLLARVSSFLDVSSLEKLAATCKSACAALLNSGAWARLALAGQDGGWLDDAAAASLAARARGCLESLDLRGQHRVTVDCLLRLAHASPLLKSLRCGRYTDSDDDIAREAEAEEGEFVRWHVFLLPWFPTLCRRRVRHSSPHCAWLGCLDAALDARGGCVRA